MEVSYEKNTDDVHIVVKYPDIDNEDNNYTNFTIEELLLASRLSECATCALPFENGIIIMDNKNKYCITRRIKIGPSLECLAFDKDYGIISCFDGLTDYPLVNKKIKLWKNDEYTKSLSHYYNEKIYKDHFI